ncbi:3'-5' exonuclease [Clostridium sp.]|uniref:3'-5' exonuclease n=1 Tax=Clostridium sp. TaxID=1506 RepID=UPI001A4FC2A8|nr:3'-5' exonuclease [Clostridium sp.]MBK5234477.1 exonuclease domain-containing protein [Clostridium sp.]
MNYIVFDLEFNQNYNFTKETKNIINPKCPFEIIQIGAVKLSDNFETIGTLDVLVKPEIYTTLNPFVKELTGITMEKLDNGKSFKEMYKDFLEFIKADRNVLCVWGTSDIKEFFRNIEYYELDKSPVPTEFINIQSLTSKHLNCKKGINIGLGNAAKLLGVPIESEFHDALNDAYYTAEVFKKIYNSEIKTNEYNPHKLTRSSRPDAQNYKIDFSNLMKQFEKMFKREMTEEEKSIIKLAYIMGKTNQFQIKISNNSSE